MSKVENKRNINSRTETKMVRILALKTHTSKGYS